MRVGVLQFLVVTSTILASSAPWSSARAAELLSSVALVDGGAILSCHEELPDRYLLTCKDKYAIFGLQCFAGAAESLVPSAVRLEYFTVNCLVETEWSSAGNGLRVASASA